MENLDHNFPKNSEKLVAFNGAVRHAGGVPRRLRPWCVQPAPQTLADDASDIELRIQFP